MFGKVGRDRGQGILPMNTIYYHNVEKVGGVGVRVLPIITIMQCGHLNLFTSKQLDIINNVELLILQESLWDKLQIIIFINYARTSWE